MLRIYNTEHARRSSAQTDYFNTEQTPEASESASHLSHVRGLWRLLDLLDLLQLLGVPIRTSKLENCFDLLANHFLHSSSKINLLSIGVVVNFRALTFFWNR